MNTRTSREGSTVPDVELAELKDGKVERLRSRDLFDKRRAIVFALPGAFTPTCSTAHVPGFVARLSDFRQAGIDDVVCISVNDPYVMDAWQRSEKAQGVHFVADPFGEFTKAMGMDVDHRDNALGLRSWRYSMLVEDGKITKMFVEPDVPGDPFQVSDADTMWKHLRPNEESIGAALMLARHGCPHCARAKALLDDQGIRYDAVHLGEELTMQGVKAAGGVARVPQVFIDGQHIGGADELSDFLSQRPMRTKGKDRAEESIRH